MQKMVGRKRGKRACAMTLAVRRRVVTESAEGMIIASCLSLQSRDVAVTT